MTVATLAGRLAEVQGRIAAAARRAGRRPEEVTLVGVSKTTDRAGVDEAYAAGLRHFGENRVQEAREKFGADMPPDLTLHLIGHLQTNKAKPAVRLARVIHSVDSIRLIEELGRQATRAGVTVDILLEINVSGEASKEGVAPDQAEALTRAAMAQPGLRPRGLMTMAPLVSDAEETRPVFRRLRQLRDQLCRAHPGWDLPDLSMGMTNDYPVAIEEGATLVRVGRAIFAG
jgi:PLP dependent protein